MTAEVALEGRPVGATRLAVEYVLPLRWHDDAGLAELTGYLERLTTWLDVTVVDGSPELFDAHAAVWGDMIQHVRPGEAGRNGKAAGVLTGLRLARHDDVVIADDDVRFTRDALEALVARLRDADAVHPQNVFSSWPWHARWDLARSLVNRAFGADLGGTTAVHRDFLRTAGGYDGDVLFENLELLRTVEAAGGRVDLAGDVHVPRNPPTVRHFLRQRVRQAYDDLAEPRRLAAELAILPLAVLGARRPWTLGLGALAAVGLGAAGRSLAGLADRVPADVPLWAPLWLAERGVCVWVALAFRLTGGVPYAGARLARAATPRRELARRTADRLPANQEAA